MMSLISTRVIGMKYAVPFSVPFVPPPFPNSQQSETNSCIQIDSTVDDDDEMDLYDEGRGKKRTRAAVVTKKNSDPMPVQPNASSLAFQAASNEHETSLLMQGQQVVWQANDYFDDLSINLDMHDNDDQKNDGKSDGNDDVDDL